jgi:toxin CptA
MHSAPAVTYPVGRSHIKRGVTWGLLLLALGVLGLWCQQVSHSAWPQGLGWGLWLLAAGLAVHDDLHSPSGKLYWDGEHWCWESGGRSLLVDVYPQLDGQRFVVLALRSSQQGLIWLWVERKRDVLQWDAVRRAVWGPRTIEMPSEGRLQSRVPDQS